MENTYNNDNSRTPRNYADVLIKWKDSGEEETVTFKLSCDYDEKEDNDIFFYCNGAEELESMKQSNDGVEFIVLDYELF